jgi:hypothetical protein
VGVRLRDLVFLLGMLALLVGVLLLLVLRMAKHELLGQQVEVLLRLLFVMLAIEQESLVLEVLLELF